MSTTGEHPAVPEAKKDPTLVAALWEIARFVVGQERLLTVVGIAALVLMGGASVVFAQDKMGETVRPVFVAIELERTDRMEADARAAEAANDVARRVTTLERVALRIERAVDVIDANQRMQMRDQGLRPIPQQPLDGGP